MLVLSLDLRYFAEYFVARIVRIDEGSSLQSTRVDLSGIEIAASAYHVTNHEKPNEIGVALLGRIFKIRLL